MTQTAVAIIAGHQPWSLPLSPPLRKQHKGPPLEVRPSPHALAPERATATVAAFPLSLALGFHGVRFRVLGFGGVEAEKGGRGSWARGGLKPGTKPPSPFVLFFLFPLFYECY